MLKSIDILLGLSVVMLVASMAVTVLTEFTTNLFNNRGRNLKSGLADMLQQLSTSFDRATAENIAAKLLTHPLIRETFGRLGTVIHREELTKLLMELASGAGPHKLEDAPRRMLNDVLAANGIADPGAALSGIRTRAMQLEASNPELASYARQNLAILHEAASDFVAKIDSWFDGTIDRVTARFTFTTRGLTFVNGFLIAMLVQLDTTALVNRLSMDDALRSSLVQQAERIDKTPLDSEKIRALARNDLIDVPTLDQWWDQWRWSKVPGILISTMLLSLGAPFWYNSLKTLLRLRSSLAEKDDDQRKERQLGPAAPGPVVIT
ncbi:MAG: hypothetical protein M3Z23_18260 [Acidobacteriota bacterium]|nr:hypothetical protein [Acidobacteriota bacterium]